MKGRKEAVDDSDPHDFTFDLSDPTFRNLLAKKDLGQKLFLTVPCEVVGSSSRSSVVT
jgi:hypothetical protein